jgi:hypothetical protein
MVIGAVTVKEPLTLCWNGQPVGQITEATTDWPWASGKLAIGNLPSEVRAVLEWFARQADSEENLEDPPFHDELLNGWSLVGADGAVTEICVPVADFEAGTVEWR